MTALPPISTRQQSHHFPPLPFPSPFHFSSPPPYSSSLPFFHFLSHLFLYLLFLPPILSFSLQAVSSFYTKYVEQGAPDSWPVKLWATLSQNSILKEKLIDFFDSQTDFSKRLTSWKANSKV